MEVCDKRVVVIYENKGINSRIIIYDLLFTLVEPSVNIDLMRWPVPLAPVKMGNGI